MRRLPLLALLLGLLLVALALAVAVSDHQRAAAEVERHLAAEADEHSGELDAYFARARAVTLLTANQASFAGFYDAPGARRAKVAAMGGGLRASIHSMRYLERLYPTAIGEVCFIDRSGAENARVVGGRVARPDELSPDEQRNPFFAPTLALPVGRVYQARPYVSPDTGEWVISNSTAIPGRDGPPRSILHFEVTVESFRRAFAPDDAAYGVYVVDRSTGAVVIDGGRPQADGAPLGNPADRRFAALAGDLRGDGLAEVDGHPVAFHRVGAARGDANDWVMVIRSAKVSPALLGDVGPLPLLLGALAVVLIAFGVVGLDGERRELQRAADTDGLTGLANRRRLVLDLERLLTRGGDPAVLVLFDLDGFKTYNDTFGHLAGDALLARLGGALAAAVAPAGGTAYRLGGDEFCIVGPAARREDLLAAALGALGERGDGFTVGASHGAVVLPGEAADPTDALRVADSRMYAAKHGRATPGRQSADVLLRALAERHPDIGHHLGGVAELAVAVAARLGVEGAELEHIRHAAELHDIGKVAIPASILGKPGPLDEEEWAFMRRHTVIGERIVAAAPALAPVGRLVRGSHERWDGRGYPDGLTGPEIPLGARVVAVCDAYDAMLTERPYQPRRPPAAALDELRRCAGTQFDPYVVDAFAGVIAARGTLEREAA